jgi:hypothetical protein
MALDSSACLKYYTQRANEHASLFVLASDMNPESEVGSVNNPAHKHKKSLRVVFYQFLSTMALGLCIGLALWWFSHSISTFATISNCKNVKCANTDFPINIFTRIGQGRIKIECGILTVLFDSKAEMVIEGPAEIELIDSLNCIVKEGRVITSMPKGESGFNVHTSFAKFHDLGTKFGVCVSKYGVAVLEVFDGQVDANHLASGKTTRIDQGERFITSINKFSKELEKEDTEESIVNPTLMKSPNKHIRISTNNGTGTDATLVRDPEVLIRKNNFYNYPDYLLMLKNCVDEQGEWDRKVYLKFDMSFLQQKKVVSGMLKLDLVNSQIGYASRCPSSIIAIYGVHEEFEAWPTNPDWQNVPASSEEVGSVDLSKAVLLGKFTIDQGVTAGSFTVKTPQLTEFINSDKNQSITLIMVRETQEMEHGGIVHCFAGGQTIDGNPPTLLLQVDE